MYANAYQNGPYLQIWDSKVDPSKNPFYKQLCKVIPNNARAFDKQAKSYLHTFQGQNSRINLPAQDSKTLALHQRYLVLHIFIPVGFQWWVELSMTDLSNLKRRINLTTVQGKQQGKYFSYRYPLEVSRGNWLFLGIDIYSFMQAFKGQTFRSLDHISIGSSCRLRRIFTMKDFVFSQIPNGFWLTHELHQSLELITFKEPSKGLLPSRLITQSITSQPEDLKKSMSNKKGQNNKSQASPNKKSPYKSPPSMKNHSLGRSQVIIENARQRLLNLQKQQELILQKSQELESNISIPKKFMANSRIKKQTIQHEVQRPNNHLKPIAQSKSKLIKSKLPPLDRSFRQDQALNIHQSQSSVPTEDHIHYQRKFLQSKEEIIEQQPWLQKSQKQRQSLEIKGGIFPSTLITKSNEGQVHLAGGESGKRGDLQLIYDQMVGCYYHPQTNSYYQLKK